MCFTETRNSPLLISYDDHELFVMSPIRILAALLPVANGHQEGEMLAAN